MVPTCGFETHDLPKRGTDAHQILAIPSGAFKKNIQSICSLLDTDCHSYMGCWVELAIRQEVTLSGRDDAPVAKY